MFKIISTAKYNRLMVQSKMYEELVKKADEEEEPRPVLHCGYKSCDFSTTDPKGLKIHRGRVHKNK